MKKTLLAALFVTAISSTYAGPYFEPLTKPNTNASARSFNNHPFKVPDNFSQEFVISRSKLSADFAAKGEEFPATFGKWDMLDFGGDNAEFVFIPHEMEGGAGVTRLNRDTGETVVLLQGVAGVGFDTEPGDGWDHNRDNFGSLDPAVVTPANTLITAEEWSGAGRMFELLNPMTATSPADADWRWLTSIPSVAHEGIQFDKEGNMYFVDENISGSIYRFQPKTGNVLTVGKTSVLVVGTGAVDGAVGAAKWVAMTDMDGRALTNADPFNYKIRGGRIAADELGATGYCRPEDMSIVKLASGNEALIIAATCSNIVYSIELLDHSNSVVREYINSNVTPDTIGNNPVATGDPSDSTYGLDDPDNVAADVAGNIFIVEDEEPGDIWMASDADKNGVAESVSLFASLGEYGSEPSGFKNDPRDPFTWYVNIQHPSAQGDNDALWRIRHDVTRYCNCQSARNHDKYVSCVAHTAKKLGIKGQEKSALMEVAVKSSCGQ